MAEINLLAKYPQAKRDLKARCEKKNPDDIRLARRFSEEYFDGDRAHGYGGYTYHPRFWQQVVRDFQAYYGLTGASAVLDVGCAKGFMLFDLKQAIPGIAIQGLDISSYAIAKALPDVQPFLLVGNARDLPFADGSFDLVISINTIHNLALVDCKKALQEIQRVTRRYAFITVDAYRTLEEKERMDMWNLTAQTYMHVDEWVALFRDVRYQGDYYWFIP